MKTLLLLIVLGVVYGGYRKVRDGPSWAQLVAGAHGVYHELFTSTEK
jgi:hypothetical protein